MEKQSVYNHGSGWFAILIAILLPLLIQLIWLLHNTQPPVSDATEPLLSSFIVYQHFIHHEWKKFLWDLYALRNGRPIAFYLLEVPFQIISSGNLLFTADSVTLLCTAATCIYIYLLLHLALPEKQAAFGTFLLGLLPSIQWPSATFGLTEIAFLPAVLATAYHTIRSGYFNDKHHSIYFVLAAFTAFSMRPVESFIHLVPIFILMTVVAWHRKIISAKHIYILIVAALAGASTLTFFWWRQHGFSFPQTPISRHLFEAYVYGIFSTEAVAILALFACLISSSHWRKMLKLQPSYTLYVFLALISLIVLYYFRFVTPLVTWVYETSLGEMATEMKKPSLPQIGASFLLCAGLLPVTTITLLGLVSFFYCISREQRLYLLHHPLCYLAAVIPFPVLVVVSSIQFTQRKVTTIICIYLLLILIPALMHGRFYRLRLTLLTTLAAWQMGGLIWIYSAHPENDLLSYTIGAREVEFMPPLLVRSAFPEMVTAFPNPHDTIANFIIDSAKRHGFKRVTLPIIGNGPMLVDPFLLPALVKMRTQDVEAIFIPYFIPNYTKDMLPKLLQESQSDAFVVIPDQPLTHSPDEIQRLEKLRDQAWYASDKIAYDLLILYVQNNMDSIGAKKVECTKVTEKNSEGKVEVCMYEIIKRPANN